MKQYSFTKWFLSALGAAIFVLINWTCIYIYCNAHIRMKSTGTVCNLGDVREAFFTFREVHGRWPDSMEEVTGADHLIREGVISELCRDVISDSPFCCVTNKRLYYRTDNGEMIKVLVMLPKPYRTKLWPFGEMKTIILTSDGNERYASPLDIVDIGQCNAEQAKEASR